MNCHKYHNSDHKTWNTFVHSAKNEHFFFLREYLDYHGERFEDFSLIITDTENKIVAVVPANRKGDRLISHQGLTFGGVICDQSMTAGKMLEVFDEIRKFLLANGIHEFIYKKVPFVFHKSLANEDEYALFKFGATLVERNLNSVVILGGQKKFRKGRIQGIKYAKKLGVEIHQSTDYKSFWPILEHELMSRHKVNAVHSFEEIVQLHQKFPRNIQLYIATINKEIISGVVCFLNKNVVHTQYIASSDKGRNVASLDLLISKIIEDFQHHVSYMSFGVSTENDGKYLNEGLLYYKESFRALSVSHDIYSWQINDI